MSNGSTTVQLFKGAEDDSFGTSPITFDDESSNAHDASFPYSSDMQPFEALSAFDGQSLGCTWTLSILDDYLSDEGNDLIFWTLTGTPETGGPFSFSGPVAFDADTDPATIVSFDIPSQDTIQDLNVELFISDIEVPEPASMGLPGAGLLGLAALRRRRKA